MLRPLSASILLLLLCAPAFGGSISGTIYLDPPALAVRADFVPTSATVKLYRDDGAQVATTAAAGGHYQFNVPSGTYWVAVDSRSIGAKVWAEQTFGPAGAVCAQNDGTTRTNFFEGACAGGRSLKS